MQVQNKIQVQSLRDLSGVVTAEDRLAANIGGVFLSAADGVGDAFLGEAGFGSPGQFLLGRRLFTRSLRVGLTLFHEACHRRARELLGASFHFAGIRIGAAARHQQCRRQNKCFHRSLPF